MAIQSLPTKPIQPGATPERVHMILSGPPGIGKTTFVHKLPNCLIVKTAPGTEFLVAERYEQAITEWADFPRLVDLLISERHRYEWIAIDTLGGLFDLAADHVIAKKKWETIMDGANGSGWFLAASYIKAQALRLAYKTKLHVVWICHTKVDEAPDPQDRNRVRKVIRPAVAPTTYDALNKISAISACMDIRWRDDGTKVRSIYFGTTKNFGDMELKDWTGRMPDTLDTFPSVGRSGGSDSDVQKFLGLLFDGKTPTSNGTKTKERRFG